MILFYTVIVLGFKMGEDRNLWDRAWTTQEMRAGAANWSLASDAGVIL